MREHTEPQLKRQRQYLHSTFEGRRGEDALLPLLGRGALGLGKNKIQREAVRDGQGESFMFMAALGFSEGTQTNLRTY